MLSGMGEAGGIGPMQGPKQTNPMGVDPSNSKDFQKYLDKPFKGTMDGLEKMIFSQIRPMAKEKPENQVKNVARGMANGVKMNMMDMMNKMREKMKEASKKMKGEDF
jgi:hypothetical protein